MELSTRQRRKLAVHELVDPHDRGGALTALDQVRTVSAIVFTAECEFLRNGVAEKLGAWILKDGGTQMTNLGQGNFGKVAPVYPNGPFQLPRSHLRNEAGQRPHER